MPELQLSALCRVYEVDWKSRIVAETDAYVVVDKPAGVSVSQLLLPCSVYGDINSRNS